MTKSDLTTTIEQEVSQLLKLMDIAPQAIAITPSEEDTVTINLTIPESDSGVLIGYHAETLSSLQRLLGLILHQRTDTWHHLIVNINNYRENREQVLQDMAHNAADRARLTGQEVIMPYLESFERRLIHLALSQATDIEAISVGEGRDRRLIIRLKPTSDQ